MKTILPALLLFGGLASAGEIPSLGIETGMPVTAWSVYGKSGCTAYYCRDGIHDLKLEDWNRFMDFTDAHGWRGKENAK